MSILRKSLAIMSTAIALAAINPAQAENGISARNPDALEQMVRQDCGSCHGLTFKGGLGSPLLPENLAAYSVEDLAQIILEGLPGTAMPPWRAIVTRDEAKWMARYLKTGESE
ncbi:c-type cytochrome [Thalassospira australica]|uniref:c-type cytochrome n=1 Tax=Thalassospira australica TaxID=1528106 RepID=UPI00384E40C3